MRRHVAIVSLLFAWVCANGAIWDVVQVFAWGKMFASYSQTMTVTQALRETFDPSKPCEMCLGVAGAKAAAKQQLPAATERSTEKLVLALESSAVLQLENPAMGWPSPRWAVAASRCEPVPVPPPRA